MKILAAFAVFNLVAMAVVCTIWVAPVAGDLRGRLYVVRNMERQYAEINEFVSAYAANVRELAEIFAAGQVLRGYQKLPALADVYRLGELWGLSGFEFGAAQPSVSFFGESRIHETRAHAEFAGALEDVISFLHEFSESSGNLRSFAITPHDTENVRIRIGFSVVGGG